LCQTIRHLLADDEVSPRWSRRAQSRMAELREEHSFLKKGGSTLLYRSPSVAEWWTFGGTKANATLAGELSRKSRCHVDHDPFTITVERNDGHPAIEETVQEFLSRDPASLTPSVEEAAIGGLKFSQCLPMELALAMLTARLRDTAAVRTVLSQQLHFASSV
jgi:ATP-dependent helicase Lhr and Lhr-like helicase